LRIEIFNKKNYQDGRALKLIASLRKHHGILLRSIRIIDAYLIEGETQPGPSAVREIFCDPVTQEILIDDFAASRKIKGWDYMIEVSYKRGVTDPVALTARDAISLYERDESDGKGKEIEVSFSTIYLLYPKSPLGRDAIERILKDLHNPLIQEARITEHGEFAREKSADVKIARHQSHPPIARMKSSGAPGWEKAPVESFDLPSMTDSDLEKLSKDRLLALSLEEMRAVKNQYERADFIRRREKRGLTRAITDVELEMIAQTWSEHCKHKIFNATIQYSEGVEGGEDREDAEAEVINSLFETYIKRTTERLKGKKGYLKSVFDDNSGVIQFDEDHLVCFKVETHNSPSALDPYGGAITGIVGVNRDIMGTGKGARPIFNTNVLCFAYPDTPERDVPERLLHPRRVMDGVHSGIVDGGNQSGIPVVAGAFLFDESFMGKPLVFCGTGGILPAKIMGEDSWVKHIDPGDLAVMVGGRIGKDGIHGATFSSLSLSESSPTSAVQIGDPITQKKMLDFLLEARDRGLYKGITDNGAGGLSSSLGEMARQSGGVTIDLSACPLKYPGLLPWEILLSESQERMSLSVAPDKIDSFLELASRRDVEATVVGKFTNSGVVEVLYAGIVVGYLDLEFLHNGLPVMKLKANWPGSRRVLEQLDRVQHNLTKFGLEQLDRVQSGREASLMRPEIKDTLLSLLQEPNIASKERLVRQYDHEVQGYSVIKPFTGALEDAPSDGALLKPLYDSEKGLTVTHGICPWYGEYDTYNMAMCAVDEALRAHVAMGGNPEEVAALDNFCWPDPVLSEDNPEGDFKLAQLVRACKGLEKACIDYEIPLISGKDSMKNETEIEGKKLSVKPTLLISLMGIIPDIGRSVSTDFKKPGDYILLLGDTDVHLLGSFYHRFLLKRGYKAEKGNNWKLPLPDTGRAKKLYTKLFRAMEHGLVSSCHDISDGGLAVAICESALGGRVGAEVFLDAIVASRDLQSDEILFSESPSRFIATISPEKLKDFLGQMRGTRTAVLGRVREDKILRFNFKEKEEPILELELSEVERNWKREI